MRLILLIPVAAGLLLAGCSQNSSSTSQSVKTNADVNYANGNPITAVPDYIGAVGQAKKYSEKQIDLAYLHQAIEDFNAAEGRYPKDLQELAPDYIGKIPKAPTGSKIVYDAKTGTVKIVKQ